VQRRHAIDEHVTHATGELIGLEGGGLIAKLIRIEHSDICISAHLEDATIGEPKNRCRCSGQPVDGLLRRNSFQSRTNRRQNQAAHE